MAAPKASVSVPALSRPTACMFRERNPDAGVRQSCEQKLVRRPKSLESEGAFTTRPNSAGHPRRRKLAAQNFHGLEKTHSGHPKPRAGGSRCGGQPLLLRLGGLQT